MKISRYYALALFLSIPACKAEAPSKIRLAVKATAHTAISAASLYFANYSLDVLKPKRALRPNKTKNTLISLAKASSALLPLYVSYTNAKSAYFLIKEVLKAKNQETESSASNI